MESFKIILFETEYKIPFPIYKTLDKTECENLISRLAEKYQVDFSNIENDLLLKQSYTNFNALHNFNLLTTLQSIAISPSSKVFINWQQFNKVDVFELTDLDQYFYDIWFPVADDIDLLDETMDWILSIRHDGVISFCKTTQAR